MVRLTRESIWLREFSEIVADNPDSYDPSLFELRNGDGIRDDIVLYRVFLGEDSDNIFGFAYFRKYTTVEDRGGAEVVIGISNHGRGLGPYVLGRLEEEARKVGLAFVTARIIPISPNRPVVEKILVFRGYKYDEKNADYMKKLR